LESSFPTLEFGGTTEHYKTYENKFIFWNYDYTDTRLTHSIPLKSIEWSYYRKRDTSGQEYNYWYTYTGDWGWNRDERVMGEINFQTWDWRGVWIGAKYQQKKDHWVHETVRIDLDDKSIKAFANYFRQLVKG
jgi:hypothetical protein